MEERFSSPTRAGQHNRDVSETDSLNHGGPDQSRNSPSDVLVERGFFPGTYVVQVPKDQIYRVPPPENALIVERHRNPNGTKGRPCCYGRRCVVLAIIAILLVGGVLAGVSFVFFKPRNPNVVINHFLLMNSTNSRSKLTKQEYHIKLKVENPNANVGIVYERGGEVLLSSKKGAFIGSGRWPSFNQDGAESKVVEVIINGSNAGLPKEMQKSMKSSDKKQTHVTLELEVDMPAKTKLGLLKSGSLEFVVSCSFTVDTLSKGSRIVSQKCQTERKGL